MSGGSELGGRTYQQAQAIYALGVDPQPDRHGARRAHPRAALRRTQTAFTGGDEGILRQASMREHKVFDQLRLVGAAAPGEMLVLMSLPDAGSRWANISTPSIRPTARSKS